MIDIRHNVRELERGLSDAVRQEIPFATSLAINDTLAEVQKNTEKRIDRVVDRPTPFTRKAFALRRSSKRNLRGVLFAKDIQTSYLRWLETGGTRRPRGRAITVPVRQRLNKYGNMPRRAIQRALARPDTFATRPAGRRSAHLPGGIYRRMKGGGLRMVAAFEGSASYTRRPLKLLEGARRTAEARLPRNLERTLRRLLAG